MTNLQQRQDKIKARRMNTPFRDFLMEIASWYTINLNKNQNIISRYPDTNRIGQIVSLNEYESLGNQEYDENYRGDFFKELLELRMKMKHPSTIMFRNNENSDYADVVFGAKNAYLAFTVGGNSENILSSTIVYENCSNVFNSVKVTQNCQNVYNCKDISESFNIFYSKYIHNSSEIWFSSNLIGCTHCMYCDDLVNQSYCINNVKYTKEDYETKKLELLKNKSTYEQKYQVINNKPNNYNSDNVQGSGISNSSNIENGFFVARATNGRNMMFVSGIDHSDKHYDVFETGVNSDDFYAVSNAGTNSNNLYCSTQIEFSSNLFYCYHMENCSFCLGCIGLKNKSYCILNKQYSKEEWYEKVDEVFGQMDRDATLGQFFPASMNPFYFNDTAAYLIDSSFTKEEVTTKGYLRRDEPIKVDIPADAKVVKSSELEQFEKFDEQGNWTINADILKYVIQDELGNCYRIIPMEYKFLVKHGLPLPRKHWLERMKENFKIN